MQQQRPIGLILLFILLGLVGQYLFKGGMSLDVPKALIAAVIQDLGRVSQGDLAGLGGAALHVVILLLQPHIFFGLSAYALSTACWLAVLSKTELSFAYPMLSIGYVAILLMGWLAFGEHVTPLRWLGVLLICVGILGIYSERRFLRWGYGFAGLLTAVAATVVLTSHVTSPAAIPDKPVAVIAVSILLGLVGQFLFKTGMNKPEYQAQVSAIGAGLRSAPQQGLRPLLPAAVTTVGLFLRPYVLGGLSCYVMSTVSWLYLLTRMPLSFLYPLLSTGYVAVLLMGWLLFHETVTAIRWYGVILICYGIITIFSEERVYAHSLLYGAGLVGMALFLGLASRSARSVASA